MDESEAYISYDSPIDGQLISKKRSEYKLQIVWLNVVLCSIIHLSALYGVYLAITSAQVVTTVFGMFNGF